MRLQIAESSLPCHGKLTRKCLYCSRQKRNFVLTHIVSLHIRLIQPIFLVLFSAYLKTAAKVLLFFELTKYLGKKSKH